MKTIRCNLRISRRIFSIFTESFYKNMGILPEKKSRNFTCLSKNYSSSISLVYVRSIEFVSIQT